MSPAEIKSNVQLAYNQAIARRNVQLSHSSSLPFHFRELKIYGREAGVDFAETHLDLIFREALAAAECKLTSLDVLLYGSGKAAIAGVAASLPDLTSLNVEIQQSAVKLIWATSDFGLV